MEMSSDNRQLVFCEPRLVQVNVVQSSFQGLVYTFMWVIRISLGMPVADTAGR